VSSDVQPEVLLRSTLVASGMSDDELARLVRRRELVPLQRGAYLPRPAADEDHRHRALVTATAAGLRTPGTVSHVSAALLHGLPLWQVVHERVHVIRRPPAAGSGSARVHLHVARLPDHEVSVAGGIAVTDVTRTVVDVARSVPFESGVVTADAALHRGLTDRDRLAACLARMGPVPGSRHASRVLAFADGRSESVGESRSRVMLQRLAVPPPDLQVRIVRRRDGGLVGRCDFGWEELGTVGEFDGRVKYGRLLRPGQTPGDAVFEEKRREDEFRDEGWGVVRWTWGDLDVPARLGDRVGRALARSAAAS